MMAVPLILFFFLQLSMAQGHCWPSICQKHGPKIQFPFRLKNHQPEHCGYPGFDLSCSPNKDTVLELPSSAKVLVKKIDYRSQSIHVQDPYDCFLRQIRNLSISASVFQFRGDFAEYALFTCPPNHSDTYNASKTCLSDSDRQVYAVPSKLYIYDTRLFNCRKMYNISAPHETFELTDDLQLTWPARICGGCEENSMYCRFKNNTIGNKTECFGKLNPPIKGRWKRPLPIACASMGSFLLAVLVFSMYYLQRLKSKKREDQAKIEKFLEDYRALKPARYSYADIKKITNQFEDRIGQGGYGTVYKGKLSNDIHVAVKILNYSKGNGDEFINEVGIISKIHHINVVRLVGYCADGFRRALIYEFLPNESLEKFISSENKKGLLGLKKLEEIALGIAKGIEYLHQGCDQQILHFDIKPHNILLDHNLNPKISDFGQAKLCSKEQSAVSMSTARGTIGYIAPEVFSRNFGNVSYKADVYSFGILLLEMVGERKSLDERIRGTSQVYFPERIYKCLDGGEELGVQIQEDGDAKITRKLAIVGLWCIQWHPLNRPSMNFVVQMLEGETETLVMPPNPFASTNSTMNNAGTSGGRHLKSELEVIVEIE